MTAASAEVGSPAAPLIYSPSLPKHIRHTIVVVMTLVTAMEFFTSYAVGVALPDIQGDLSASFDEGSWILTVYTVCFLIGLILSNWLAETVGYRRHMINAVCLFALSSVCCGLSHDLRQMLFCRAVMGFAGGTFLVRAQTAIGLTHTGKDRARAMLFFGLIVVGVARTFGAAIGGYLAEWHTWRSIFFVNLPFELAAVVMMLLYVPDFRAEKKPGRLDVVGLLLLIGFVAPVQIVLSRGQRDEWFADARIITLTALAGFCLTGFVWWSLRPGNTRPIVNLHIYRNRNFVLGSIYVVFLGIMLYGQLYVVPQFVRGIQHYSDWATGKLQTINAVAFFIGLVGGSLLTPRLGVRVTLSLGAVFFTAGMAAWAVRMTAGISPAAMTLPLILTGLGAGWQITPLSVLINSQTPVAMLGEGIELYLFQRQLGGSWGIAVLAILIDRRRSFWSGRLGEEVNAYSLATRDTLREGTAALHFAGLPLNDAAGASVGIVHGRLLVQSIVNAFVDTYWYQVGIGLAALAIIVLFARAKMLGSAVRWAVTLVR